MADIKKFKPEKKKEGKKPFTSWFVLVIVIAVVLSLVISLLVVNLSIASAQKYSMDSGIVTVEINPQLNSDSGKIVVEIKGEEVS